MDHHVSKGTAEKASLTSNIKEHDTELAKDDLLPYLGRMVRPAADGKASVESGETYLIAVENHNTGVCAHAVETDANMVHENRSLGKIYKLSLKPLVAICDSVPARNRETFASLSEKVTGDVAGKISEKAKSPDAHEGL